MGLLRCGWVVMVQQEFNAETERSKDAKPRQGNLDLR